MRTVTLAWESSTWWWNDLGHGMGAFLTSAGFAGLTAVAAASIAAYQVSKTRSETRAAARRDQLWQRFEWIAANRPDLGAATTAQMLVGLEAVAKSEEDANLVDIIATSRRRTARQGAARVNSPGQT